jgi:hypothetical protein
MGQKLAPYSSDVENVHIPRQETNYVPRYARSEIQQNPGSVL